MKSFRTLLLLLALLLPLGAWAAPAVVLDEADILSAETEDRLRTIAEDIRAASGKDLLVVTVPRVVGSPQEHADRLFRDHDLDGVLLYVAPQERQLGIVPGRQTQELFPRTKTGPIREEMLALFAEGDYDEGVLVGAREVRSVFGRAGSTAVLPGPGDAEGPAAAPAEPRSGGGLGWAFLLIPLVLGGLVFLLVIGFVVGLARRMSGRRHSYAGRPGDPVPGAGPYTRHMGGGPVYGPGYGGGFGSGGGGFWPSLFGGLGGAMAGHALYDWMTPDAPEAGAAPSDVGWQGSDLGSAGGGDFGGWDSGGGDWGGGEQQW